MSQFNNLIDVTISFVIILVVFLGTMVGIFVGNFEYSKNYTSDWTQMSKFKFLPQSKAGIITLSFSIIFVIIIIVCAILGTANTKFTSFINRNSTTITNPGTENFGNNSVTSTYNSVGYGPVIDRTKIQNWLDGSAGSMGLNLEMGKSAWPDGNGNAISIPTEQFKSLYGFIPPSIEYYPKGQSNNDYNGTNYQSGRENCMKACSLTNCTAVQTEVPENCSQKANDAGTDNSCGENSAFSCTLFYDTIGDADDAYWNINNFNSALDTTSPGCFEITGSSCLGKKYYEDSSVPIELIDKTIKPSQNPVTFCDSSITKTNSVGYGNVNCSCVDAYNCKDPNCCIMRPLLTTEYIQNRRPYYALPLNISKVKGAVTGDYSMVVPSIDYKNGVGTSCGIVGTGATAQLSSCTSLSACGSSSDTTDCWEIDSSTCTGDPFDILTGTDALFTYIGNYAASKGQNYDDLYKSCYYRQKMTMIGPIQFNCDPAIVDRGCWGSPPIIFTDSLSSPGNFAACSDTSTLPDSQRCQNASDLASCTGFPYSCSTNNGTNTLWVKQ